MQHASLFTPVTLPTSGITLTSESRILLLGSCFAQEVGQRLVPQFPEGQVTVNPLGPIYSPTLLAQTLRAWLRKEPPLAPFLGRDERWHSWQASSVCSAATREECEAKLQAAWLRGCEALHSATHLVLTFGTTRYYQLQPCAGETALKVSNCHKEPSARFQEQEPTLQELTEEWDSLFREMRTAGIQCDIVLTVSPYRYRKYGMHTSQLQKSKLLLLCDALQPHTHYFPSYEILLDELRDYRFYAADLLHPSEQAVDIIAERFREWCFTPALMTEAQERLRQYRREQHRTLIES